MSNISIVHKSEEFVEENLQFTPLGELGIGIISCFMISEKVEIHSKTDNPNSKPIYVELEDISDYLFIDERTNDTPVGTCIQLILKDDLINESNLRDIVGKFVRDIEFPIIVNGNKIKSSGHSPAIEYLNAPMNIKNLSA